MLDNVSDKLLVRRVRAGDCAALAPLLDHLHEPLTGFCESLTGDRRSAEQAATDAFEISVKRLAAHRIPAREFRSTLMSQARDGCYDAITRASAADLEGETLPQPDPVDIDELCREIRELVPTESKGMHLRPRSRLSPATAVAIGLMMVVMVDLVTMGSPFGGDKPTHRQSAERATPIKQAANSTVALASTEKRQVAKHSKRARRHRAPDRAPSSKVPTENAGGSGQSTASPATADSGSPNSGKPESVSVPDVPAVGQVELPPVEVKVPPVEVNAGPVQVKADLPDVSACVGALCAQLP